MVGADVRCSAGWPALLPQSGIGRGVKGGSGGRNGRIDGRHAGVRGGGKQHIRGVNSGRGSCAMITVPTLGVQSNAARACEKIDPHQETLIQHQHKPLRTSTSRT